MPRIGIIGRQNVGKSTLFNALLKRQKSIVLDQPGVTRDLVNETVDWGEGNWELADFPGFESDKETADDPLTQKSIHHALDQLAEFHLLLWVVSRHGLNGYEHELLNRLRKFDRPVWLVINFVDDPSLEADLTDFYGLGFDHVSFVSGLNGRGIKELRQQLQQHFASGQPAREGGGQSTKTEQHESQLPRLAIVGKPNAGKSTLFNWLLKKEKALVSDVPGTTRDALDEVIEFEGQDVEIVDTAGMRKKRKISRGVEAFSIARTERAIGMADSVLLLIDPEEGFDRQNKSILALLEKANKPVVICINKVDLLEKESKRRADLEEDATINQEKYWQFPLYFISAQDGRKVTNAVKQALQLAEVCKQRHSTAGLNRLLGRLRNSVALQSNKIKANYITQAEGTEFLLFANRSNMPSNVEAYVRNELRKALKLHNVPVRITVRKKNPPKEGD